MAAVPRGQAAGDGGREHQGRLPGGGGAQVRQGRPGVHAGGAGRPADDEPGGEDAVMARHVLEAGDAAH